MLIYLILPVQIIGNFQNVNRKNVLVTPLGVTDMFLGFGLLKMNTMSIQYMSINYLFLDLVPKYSSNIMAIWFYLLFT